MHCAAAEESQQAADRRGAPASIATQASRPRQGRPCCARNRRHAGDPAGREIAVSTPNPLLARSSAEFWFGSGSAFNARRTFGVCPHCRLREAVESGTSARCRRGGFHQRHLEGLIAPAVNGRSWSKRPDLEVERAAGEGGPSTRAPPLPPPTGGITRKGGTRAGRPQPWPAPHGFEPLAYGQTVGTAVGLGPAPACRLRCCARLVANRRAESSVRGRTARLRKRDGRHCDCAAPRAATWRGGRLMTPRRSIAEADCGPDWAAWSSSSVPTFSGVRIECCRTGGRSTAGLVPWRWCLTA